MEEREFTSLWNSLTEFAVNPEGPRCSYAAAFGAWAGELCTKLTGEATPVGVNQAIVLLTKKYFEWRSSVPKSHRDRLGSASHVCIYQVYVEAFERLRVVELSLNPPMLFLPEAAPPPRPAPQIAGIFIGEDEES